MMEFLIGTHSLLMWVRVSPSWDVVDQAVLNTGHHYGIALLDNEANSVLCKHVDDRLQLYERSTPYELTGEIPLLGLHEHIHQIAQANGGVYIANTKRNSVVFQGFDDGIRHEYWINGVDYDLNHVNSVFPCGSQVLVLLNNRGRTESQVLVFDMTPSRGWVLLRSLSLWHRGCHNVFAGGRYLVYNASSQGRFCVVDLRRQKLVVNRRFGSHTKGLSVTDRYFIIGVSEHTDRENRYSSTGRLVVMDRRTCDVVANVRFGLPQMGERVGNINEIRCVSETEYAHSAPSPTLLELSSLNLAASDPMFRARERLRREARGIARAIGRTASR